MHWVTERQKKKHLGREMQRLTSLGFAMMKGFGTH
jgi:hypothetical protein